MEMPSGMVMPDSKLGIIATLTLLIYLWLYMLPFPLTEINVSSFELNYYYNLLDRLNGAASHLLFGVTGLHSKAQTVGSGDSRYDYSMLITRPAIAFLLAVFLSLVLRKESYPPFFRATVLYARYFVGLYLLLYSASKFFESQFPLPRYEDLERKYGDMSPMDLLWLFMGYSPAYCAYTAVGEFLGGILLLFRRTVVLGGLISMAAMSNVVALNFTYDVPVKLFSSHLFLISLFLVWPNLRSLFLLFFRNEAATLSNAAPVHFSSRWVRICRLVCKTTLIIGAPVYILKEQVFLRPDPLYSKTNGTYILEKIKSKKSHSDLPLQRLILENGKAISVNTDGVSQTYFARMDSLNHTLNLINQQMDSKILAFKMDGPTKGKMVLQGDIEGDSVQIHFRQIQKEEYPLLKRGFHWINEYPYYVIY